MITVNIASSLKSPLKWAGGKGRLIPQLSCYLPAEMKHGRLPVYFEPFLGGGAMFFYLASHGLIKSAYLSDANADLINFYTALMKSTQRLITEAGILQDAYNGLSNEFRADFYNSRRADFNSYGSVYDVERAALFLFLNKTCFNGLYRVNSRGEFNTAFGKYKSICLIDSDLAFYFRDLMVNSRAEIFIGDYSTIDYAHAFIEPERTFVYYDPPYRALSASACFTSYTENGFSDTDHKQLAEHFFLLSKYGIRQMLSNSNPKNTNENDHFFDDLYAAPSCRIGYIEASRAISGKAESRGKITELVITNYVPEQ